VRARAVGPSPSLASPFPASSPVGGGGEAGWGRFYEKNYTGGAAMRWDIIIEERDWFWPVCWKCIIYPDCIVVVRESPHNPYVRGEAEVWTTESGKEVILHENEVAYEYTPDKFLVLLEDLRDLENVRVRAGEWILEYDYADPRIVEKLREADAWFTSYEYEMID
jgi:hypothetical protein